MLSLYSSVNLAQDCSIDLKGKITDHGTGEALSFVTVSIIENRKVTFTDSLGFFSFEAICEGDFHIQLSHVGCDPIDVFATISRDTFLYLDMEHSVHLDHIVIDGKEALRSAKSIESLREVEISDNGDKNIADLLDKLPGVSTLQSGSGISKPIIHGLFGNRISILNNGIAQSGQQWGNDHSPEIDPLSANRIQVIKGASSLEYMGAQLGGIILVKPSEINTDPHLHGKLNYVFNSNGRSNGLHFQAGKSQSNFDWKLTSSLKISGDNLTPDYYLNNTGSREANFTLQVEKSFSNRLKFDAYFSSFNTSLGVLRGSHISTREDLELAFIQEVPFYTEESFTYHIDAPRQQVHHQLGKLHALYFNTESSWWEFTLAAQYNDRKEYDIRRSGLTSKPALSLDQFTLFAEAKYQKELTKRSKLKTGIQFNLIDNTNNPETKVLPLIPDYRALESGTFILYNYLLDKWTFEFGARYDNILQDVATISSSLPRKIVRYYNIFHNISENIGIEYRPIKYLSVTANVSHATRNPAINELYSNGLHQGVSGIEEGDAELEKEQSIKSSLGLKFENNVISFQAISFYQRIHDYIYLQVQDELRPTIRGVFPVFTYEQTDADIYGGDISLHWNVMKFLYVAGNYSHIVGKELDSDLSLIYIPSNSINGEIGIESTSQNSIAGISLKNPSISFNARHTFQQNNITSEQDIVLPPAGYSLLNLRASIDLPLNNSSMRIVFRVENMMNTRYRNYLNRQRYFANDLGRAFIVGANWKF